MEIPDELAPFVIRGCHYTIRTFADHGLSRELGVPTRHKVQLGLLRYVRGLLTLDKLVTITLPFIRGYTDKPCTCVVHLYDRQTEINRLRSAGVYVDGRATRYKKPEPIHA